MGSADNDAFPLKGIIFVTNPSFSVLARARSAQIGRPEGVTRSFHVSLYKIEPSEPSLARNLFAIDDWRAALADEMVPSRPKVPLVSNPSAFTCRAERLARTTTRPDWS
jgi:hypothetical protein|tara:strand:- start:256 stop:582 length:327 start_codon:yes stop_codon:yes gene_type:complete